MANKVCASQPLAHSPRRQRGIPAQFYSSHVGNTVCGTLVRANGAAKFSRKWGDLLIAVVRPASEYHDLGKLDPANQDILHKDTRQPLPVRHEDGGVAHLLDGAKATPIRLFAALLVHSHHRGLPAVIKQQAREELCYRFNEPDPEGRPVHKRTSHRLDDYRRTHTRIVVGLPPSADEITITALPQMFLRVALSCLIDADHSDTAIHYKSAPSRVPPGDRWAERLASLDAYVEGLSSKKGDVRTSLRTKVYQACRRADPRPELRECDSPVGTGKTTAVMAHLLKAAEEKQLRRIFVVLPFTNIIDQAVDVYRRSLVLPGEDPEAVIAAVHHKAEYKDPDSRHLAALWDAPVVVTTAVQFFETLASSSTGGLRKLHSLIGSGVFIDESHAALPAKLWPQAWDWIKQLATEWGCHFVLGSGSLNRIWTIQEIEPNPIDLPPLVELSTQANVAEAERKRWSARFCEQPLTLEGLANRIDSRPGPRLVIVNTVQIAAALAEILRKRNGKDSVMHLSTALTPHDRAITLERVKTRLAYKIDTDWTLVATSCVEAGVDLSFRTGFRQRASLASLLQTAGRINRNGEYETAEVWDFQLVLEGLVNVNPALEYSAEILGNFIEKGQVSPDYCTAALRDEILQTRRSDLNKALHSAESSFNFPEVQKLFHVIEGETRTVIVSRSLQEQIEQGEPIDWRELQRHSVQIYAKKVEGLRLREAQGHPGLFVWDPLPYDDFLGYMAGVLPLVRGGLDGGFIV